MELAGSLVSRGACPRGKTFYSCLGNRFSGCCSLDPCDLSDCPDDWAGESGKGRLGDRDQGGKGTTASSTKTDSGITHTVPNPSVVTVTRHTVVFSEAPSSTTVSAEDAATLTSGYAPTSTPAETASSATSSTRVVTSTPASNNGDGEAASLSSGAIVGTVAGGIVLGVVFVVLVIAWRRRKRSKAASDAGSVAAFPDGLGSSPDAEKPHEQQHRRPRSAHTTGSSDPFAPFGGETPPPHGAAAAAAAARPQPPASSVNMPSRPRRCAAGHVPPADRHLRDGWHRHGPRGAARRARRTLACPRRPGAATSVPALGQSQRPCAGPASEPQLDQDRQRARRIRQSLGPVKGSRRWGKQVVKRDRNHGEKSHERMRPALMHWAIPLASYAWSPGGKSDVHLRRLTYPRRF